MPTRTADIVHLLKADHEEVDALLRGWEEIDVHGRATYFDELVRTLVRHEVAEEVAIYPVIRSLPGGADQADARIKEQAEAEQLLDTMERLGPEGSDFAESFRELRASVLDHAQAEEREAFPLLDAVPANRRAQLVQRYERAKGLAPTRPHPNAPDTPPGNKVLGPLVGLFDRVRDAAREV